MVFPIKYPYDQQLDLLKVFCDLNPNDRFVSFYYYQSNYEKQIKARNGFKNHNTSMETKRSKIYSALTGDVKARYENKILECGGIDPYTLVAKDLTVDPKDFPEITVLDIGNYMIQSVSPYTKRSFNAYKITEAYSFFESGFVLNLGSKKTNSNDLAILIGRVKHSQRMNESPLKVWILANMNGKIICAHCNCLAGLSETCSHVAAICFAVSNIGESRDIKSVTDMLCKWNIPSFKDVSMSSVTDIHWRYSSLPQEDTKHETNFLKYCNSIEHLSDERIDEFIKNCHYGGDMTALGFIVIPSDGRRKTSVKDNIFLSSLYKNEYKCKSLSQLVEIGKSISLNVSDEEVKEISRITLNKEKSKFYLWLRRGRITGSNFKNCCVTPTENPSLTAINYTINPRNLDNVPNITYQNKNRKKAIEQYTRTAMLKHENFVYNQCGLIINPNLPYFVGSPDGIISCSCHGNGCVVTKCLKILESGGSFDVLTDRPNNILNKQGNHYVLEKSHEFYYQVQLQINLISLKYCDLLFWSPEESLLVRIKPDFEFWKIAKNKGLTFHEQVIMPELLGKFYTGDTKINDKEEDLELIGLEIEILCSDVEQKNTKINDKEEDPELIGLEIDILCSNEEQKIRMSSDASDGDDHVLCEHICKSQHKLESVKKISQKSKSKNNVSDVKYVDSLTDISVTNARNLKKLSTHDILQTFFEHEDKLKQLYGEQIKQLKRNYRPKDLPEIMVLDIVNEKQLQAMANFAESKLANIEEEHNSTDVIFDAIMPEWALAVFCKEFNLARSEAVEVLKVQSRALIEMSES